MEKIITQMWHVPMDQFTIKATVVRPIPADLTGGAGTGAGMPAEQCHQRADATLFLNNSLVLGYQGNTSYDGMNKEVMTFFKTPITPASAMEFADFEFGLAPAA